MLMGVAGTSHSIPSCKWQLRTFATPFHSLSHLLFAMLLVELKKKKKRKNSETQWQRQYKNEKKIVANGLKRFGMCCVCVCGCGIEEMYDKVLTFALWQPLKELHNFRYYVWNSGTTAMEKLFLMTHDYVPYSIAATLISS